VSGYVEGEVWWRTLGLASYHGHSYREFLEHVVLETDRALRARGLDPELRSVRGDRQNLLRPYQAALIRECHEAYLCASDCLAERGSGIEQQLRAVQLERLWNGQALAAIAGPKLLAAQRRRIATLATQRASTAKRRKVSDQKLQDTAGMSSQKQRARAIGVHPTTLSRAKKRKNS
jgi:hypothetical protein